MRCLNVLEFHFQCNRIYTFQVKRTYNAIFKMADLTILKKNHITLALFELEAYMWGLDVLEFDF